MKKKFAAVLVAVFCSLFVCASPAFACTGMYIGSDASADGTTMIAKSNDTTDLDKPLIAKVYGGKDGEKISQINSENGFSWDLPKETHRTICYPTVKSSDYYSYNCVAMNDCGVVVNATVSAYCNDKVHEIDPLVEGGIVEDQFPLTICLSVSSAREGVELVAKIIDEKGSGEDNIIMIGDQKEAWYMEIYSGHQYCAVKAPSDCVAVIGNEYELETVDENSPDVICSPQLFKMPVEHGFAVNDENGKMNIYNTYAGPDVTSDASRMRTWRGHNVFAPSTSGDYNIKTKYPLFYKPDHKISLQDVEQLFRDRYEQTPYSLDTNGKNSYRAINIETSQSTHVTQIFKDVPAEMALVNWVAFSDAEFNVFVPFSNIENNFDSSYTYDTKNYYNLDNGNAFSAHRKLGALAAQNRLKLKTGIEKYWNFWSVYMSSAIKQIINEASNANDAHKKITEFCCNMQNQTYYDSGRIFDEVNWYLMNTDVNFKRKTINGEKVFVDSEAFEPYIDAALAAKMLGWQVDENKLQAHNNENYDEKVWGDINQGDNGGKEGFVKISNGENCAEIHTNNGHRVSKAIITINGEEQNFKAKVNDGKTFVEFGFIEKLMKLNNSDYSVIGKKDLSSSNNYHNALHGTWFNIVEWPIWMVVVFVFVITIILSTIAYFIVSSIRNKRSKK